MPRRSVTRIPIFLVRIYRTVVYFGEKHIQIESIIRNFLSWSHGMFVMSSSLVIVLLRLCFVFNILAEIKK